MIATILSKKNVDGLPIAAGPRRTIAIPHLLLAPESAVIDEKLVKRLP